MERKKYMVVDTETATLPFANEIACGDSEKKKRIAIAKPLVYDIGWTITDRQGTIYDKKQFLVVETFCVPAIFNTAYYAEKRPIYLAMLESGETCVKPWNEIMEIFIDDMKSVCGVGAFNSMFDFKKAIPFTELYIKKLYSADYFSWESMQKKLAQKIADGEKPKNEREFEAEIFRFRGNVYPLFDLWGLATSHILNNATYKKKCIEYNLLTNSGTFFKTSAESSYKYLCDKYDFVESHTALDDAIIESFILSKIAKRHAIDFGIKYFPFRDLGYTDEFCMRRKQANLDECRTVYNAMIAYIAEKMDESEDGTVSAYTMGIINKVKKLAEYANMDCIF